jgi:hypothetical protein
VQQHRNCHQQTRQPKLGRHHCSSSFPLLGDVRMPRTLPTNRAQSLLEEFPSYKGHKHDGVAP